MNFPGEFPYTRGIEPGMYRENLWLIGQYGGFGSPEETNRRFKYLLSQGITAFTLALDLPTTGEIGGVLREVYGQYVQEKTYF